MAEKSRWETPLRDQPKAEEFSFDLDGALESVVALRAVIPPDAFTASILGVERAGSGIVIRESGLVLTIGYLITEAESVWLTGADGRVTQAHALAYDQETGFGLVQALGRLGLPALELGSARAAKLDDPAILAGGGRSQSVRARIAGKQEFTGYWEYLLDEALFTAPAHPFWGGAGLIGQDGKLLGIGSLHVQQVSDHGQQDVNMIVPIDLLPPILDDLLAYSRAGREDLVDALAAALAASPARVPVLSMTVGVEEEASAVGAAREERVALSVRVRINEAPLCPDSERIR